MLLKITPPATLDFDINGFTLEMIEVQGGSFMMGGDEYDREKPIHKVTLDSFLIGKYPVTQALWSALMPKNPSEFKGPNRPVEQVTWLDAAKFCNVLSKNQGLKEVYEFNGEVEVLINYESNGFRLPTEAEWECAAKGGVVDGGKYYYAGSNDLNFVSWHESNCHEQSQPVGLKMPNQLGIYDMSGNVWEWCNDWYMDYTEKEEENPIGSNIKTERVRRGGSWRFDYRGCRVAYRRSKPVEFLDDDLGFRLVLKR
ncbi:MAG: SUMF1/EgtB/PvdO family nonheme iron enzyme [Bacteroidia bacterium]